MAEAEVGDDDYGEDPTVRALEEAFAARVGKAAALFVPSGVMANQIAVRVLSQPGTAVVAGCRQHVVAYEYGAAPMNAGIQFIPVDDGDGMLRADDVRHARLAAEHHQPAVSLVCIENTHMAASGAPWTRDRLRAVVDAAGRTARAHGRGAAVQRGGGDWRTGGGMGSPGHHRLVLPVQRALRAGGLVARRRRGRHCRRAPGAQAARWRHAPSRRARRPRPAGLARHGGEVGGGPRTRAARLAVAVAERWPESGLDPAAVRTNIVTFTHPSPDKLLAYLDEHGVLAHAIAPETMRFVTHRDVDDDGIARAMEALASAPGGRTS